MARDYVISMNKSVKSKDSLSNSWFYDFLKRWPDLKIVKPQKRVMSRANCVSKENLDNNFKERGTILTVYDLKIIQKKINFDETGVSTEQSPSKIDCSKDSSAQSVTSPRTYNVTIIKGGNALGNQVPPYEPRHEISNNVVCATSKASNQPGHTRILIRDFACRSNFLWVFSY